MASKKLRAAHHQGDATRLNVEQLPGQLDNQDRASILSLQACWLVRHRSISPAVALTVAALAFGGAPQ